MLEAWTANGQWWTPYNPDAREYGSLSWAPEDECQLVIRGLMPNDDGSSTPFAEGPEVILGESDDGRFYTCLRTRRMGTRSGTHDTSYISTILRVQTVLAGQHFDSAAAIRFRRVRFIYSNLHEWHSGNDPLTIVEVARPPGSRGTACYQVTNHRGVIWEFTSTEGLRIGNDFDFDWERLNQPTFKYVFSHADGIDIISPEPAGLNRTFYSQELRFRFLISLLADFPLQIASVSASSDEIGFNSVKIYDRRLSRVRRQPDRAQFAPVLFNHLGPQRFQSILGKWLEIFTEIHPVAGLYLATRFAATLDLQSAFLQVMQALEAYHRTFHAGHVYMTKDEYDSTVGKALLAAIPQGAGRPFRDKLKGMIKYGNEYSLRRKLDELLNEVQVDALRNEARAKGFLSQSVETRNFLVHRDPQARASALGGADLYTASRIWQEVLFSLLLGRAGATPAEISRASAELKSSRGVYIAAGEAD